MLFTDFGIYIVYVYTSNLYIDIILHIRVYYISIYCTLLLTHNENHILNILNELLFHVWRLCTVSFFVSSRMLTWVLYWFLEGGRCGQIEMWMERFYRNIENNWYETHGFKKIAGRLEGLWKVLLKMKWNKIVCLCYMFVYLWYILFCFIHIYTNICSLYFCV